MIPLAPILTTYLREHLPNERALSPNTVATYAHAFTLLVRFTGAELKKRPTDLTVEDLAPALVLRFLDHIEDSRSNGARTRNARLAAIHAFFRYVEYRVPSCLDQALRIRTIPRKRSDERLVIHLTRGEIEALLSAPDPSSAMGKRDRAMLHLAYAAGLRASELLSLREEDFQDRSLQTVHVVGKGRRERVLPLWKETRRVISAWIESRPSSKAPELFTNKYGRRMSRDSFAHRLRLHTETAAREAPSLAKKRVTPHVLRHSCAVHTLEATGDIRKVALWLGHSSTQTTEMYLRVDTAEKLATMKGVVPPTLKPGKFKPPSDPLLAMLTDATSSR